MKTKRRLYVPDAALAAGAEIALREDHAHYLVTVLRLGAGDEVHLFNDKMGEWRGEITRSRKQEARILLQDQIRLPLVSCPLHLTLAFAPLKKDRTDFLVEKASELGVHTLQPVFTDHTQSDRVNTERLQTTAIEAAEQCDRLNAPQVLAPVKLKDYLQSLSVDALLFLAAESGDAAPIAEAFFLLSPPGRGWREAPGEGQSNIHFLIGPEGGFNDKEFAAFARHPSIRPIRLGPRLLRAETAAVAVLSAFQAIAGDWRTGGQES